MFETATLTTERMTFGPTAVGRLPDGKVVFVRGGAPSEKVRIRLLKSHKKHWDADIEEILEPSPDRVKPPCPVYGACGGCDWQHLRYDAQIREKKNILTHQLARAIGKTQAELNDLVLVHAASQPFGYRNRIQIHGDREGIGFYAVQSKTLVPTETCAIAHPTLQERWTNFLKKDFKRLLNRQGGRPFKIEWTLKDGEVLEAINLHHAALGFTQINSKQNEVLRSIVAKAAGKGKTLVDLFGGEGNLSQNLPFDEISCVDLYNSGPKTEGAFHLVREAVDSFVQKLQRPDVVIADPPREGLERVAAPLSNLGATTVILVSCDPSTLARDLALFKDNYNLTEVHLVDMFPQTHHLEAVVVLRSLKTSKV